MLLAAMGALIMFISSFWGSGGLTIGLLLALAMVGGSYWMSDKLAIRSARAIEVEEGQLPEYWSIMKELCDLSGQPMPRIYVSPDPQPNAFATGRNPANAAVCVTEGLIQHLSWTEIRGVLAHEMAHIKNRDILIGSVAAAIAMAISFVANMAQFAMIFGGNRDRDRNPLVDLLLIIVAPIAAALIQMAISRSREYQADRTAARMIGDGEPLAAALEKLDMASRSIPSLANANQAQMYIANPLAGRQMAFRKMFTTHPPMDERIARLRNGSWRDAV
ncbi:MAG TPA: protease HtpX [Acidimicrobiaceae bacterium]|nr:protease HtpX [Acidimicrobiaceae bacterium]HAA65381.1 protease HtpX [Acidimicrobiaceae bacterium]HAY66512.1 protease HtpX [Acidimicrobiaceae bacterium]HBV25268.1 protease HtpX [Acidimicrobiaceae bacterium]|tara:strand:- start:628 stop:1455 length:828 start_codon:yes stop_codon:yes gene_type:complete